MLYLYNTRTKQVANVPIQSDGECLWVDAADLPTWADQPSADFALHQILLNGEPHHTHKGARYCVPIKDPPVYACAI